MLGLDIGGANLKASDGEARSVSRPFAIWREPDRLADELRALLAPWSDWRGLAVTMTAELADCFATKAEGVERILEAVERAAAGREVVVWQTGGEFVSPADARELTPLVAAANWHVLATWAGRLLDDGCGLLVDIGSTTTDIIPISGGLPDPQGRTDVERLQSGELVYAGVRRTPLCALAGHVTLRGRPCALAAELFATTRDLFLLTGDRPAEPACCDTADGRPATQAAAHSRLAHMLCCDATELPWDDAVAIAGELQDVFIERLRTALTGALDRMRPSCRGVLLSGEGEFLARRVLAGAVGLADAELFSLSHMLGPDHSAAACAFALARLARERVVT